MRHPAQDIRHTTSVAKQFVESDYIWSNANFFWLHFFRVFSVNVFAAAFPSVRGRWEASSLNSAGAIHQEQFS